MPYKCGDPMAGYWHKCPMCGKEFYARSEWVYQRRLEKGEPIYFHTYSCMNKYDEQIEEIKRQKKEAKKNGTGRQKAAGTDR